MAGGTGDRSCLVPRRWPMIEGPGWGFKAAWRCHSARRWQCSGTLTHDLCYCHRPSGADPGSISPLWECFCRKVSHAQSDPCRLSLTFHLMSSPWTSSSSQRASLCDTQSFKTYQDKFHSAVPFSLTFSASLALIPLAWCEKSDLYMPTCYTSFTEKSATLLGK